MYDTKIYYDSLADSNFIECNTSDWVVENYTISFRTWLNKSDWTTLRSNIVPGATGELFSILGKPTYIDKTWQGNNTIKIVPVSTSNSTIKNMRREVTGYVKNVTTHTIEGVEGWIEIKLEFYVSGSVY